MDALKVDLMGSTPIDEAMIQARTQDIIARDWPAWKRERALRLSATGEGAQLEALNTYLDTVSATVDQCRADSALLRGVLVYEAAQRDLALPDMYSAETVTNEEGEQVPSSQALWEMAWRSQQQAVIDSAASEVIALALSRVPVPVVVADPEPELPA